MGTFLDLQGINIHFMNIYTVFTRETQQTPGPEAEGNRPFLPDKRA
jgi:hypothetical protein